MKKTPIKHNVIDPWIMIFDIYTNTHTAYNQNYESE